MTHLRLLDLCAGIGGFSLAASWLGVEVGGQVEIDSWSRRVLHKHWPDAIKMADVFEVEGDEFGPIDIITAGFPCQPYSLAGKRRGGEDDRAIWPEIARIVRRIKPRWCLFENVPGLITIPTMGLDTVLADLEADGYTAGAVVVPAGAVNALHRRDRVWIMAHRDGADGEARGTDRMGTGAPARTCRCSGRHATEAVADTEHGTGESRHEPQEIGRRQDDTEQARVGRGGVAWHRGGWKRRADVPDGPRDYTPIKGPGEDVADTKGIAERKSHNEADPDTGSGNARAVPIGRGDARRGDTGGAGEGQASRPLDAGADGLPAGSLRRPSARSAWDNPDLIRAMWADGSWEADLPRVVTDEPERRQKLMAAGNAIVPLVAYEILRVMMEDAV